MDGETSAAEARPGTAAICPRCGGQNDCALADGRPLAACWCAGATIAPAVLDTLPASARGQACLCPACAHAAAPAPFTVTLPGPLDLTASLDLFRRAGDDGIDRWDGQTLVRTLAVDGRTVAYAATSIGTADAPAFQVTVTDAAAAPAVAAALAATFLPRPATFAALTETDPVVAHLAAALPGLRPVRQFDLLAALLRCISAQQVNLRWAATLRRRLVTTYGVRHVVAGHEVYHLEPARVAALSPAAIRALQFTMRKAESIVAVATAIADGRLDLAALEALPDEEVIERLTVLPGIGRWSAEWILARALGRPCVVAGDLGVRKAVGLAYLATPLPDETAVRRATTHWGPAAGQAQALLLHALSTDQLHALPGQPPRLDGPAART